MKDYVIYSKGEKLLDESGLSKRIDDYLKSDDIPYFNSFLQEEDIFEEFKSLKERGFIELKPDDESIANYHKSLDQSFRDKNFKWSIDDKNYEVKDCFRGNELALEQTLLLGGIVSSYFFSTNEFWDFEKFGFSSITEMHGLVGAKILNGNFEFKAGKKWISEFSDGITLESQITGDGNADLRIYQEDVTEYDVIDPFGNEVLYRPKIRDEDSFALIGYHSTEISFLGALLAYHKTLKFESEYLKKPKKLLEFVLDNSSTIFGSTTEHLSKGIENLSVSTIDVDVKYVILDESNLEKKFLPIMTENNHSNIPYVNENKELVYRNWNNKDVFRMQAKDFDSVLESLMYQATNYLGRTNSNTLLATISCYLEFLETGNKEDFTPVEKTFSKFFS